MNKKWSILETIIILFFFGMILITFLGVISRYVFSRPIMFNEELARLFLINIVLIGAILNSRDKNQLRVTFFYNFFSTKIKKKVDLAINIIIILAMAALIYYGIILIFVSQKQYTTVLHIPWTIIYSIIPIFSTMILVYHLRDVFNFIKNKCTRGK